MSSGNLIAASTVAAIAEQTNRLLHLLTATPVSEPDSINLYVEAAETAFQLERLINPKRWPFGARERGLWGKPPRVVESVQVLLEKLNAIYSRLEWKGVCDAADGIWWTKEPRVPARTTAILDSKLIDKAILDELRQAVAHLESMLQSEYGTTATLASESHNAQTSADIDTLVVGKAPVRTAEARIRELEQRGGPLTLLEREAVRFDYSELGRARRSAEIFTSVTADHQQAEAKGKRRQDPKRGRPNRKEADTGAKTVAALLKHHGYENGSCLNSTPAVANELAATAEIAPSSVSRFFKAQFPKRGYAGYSTLCLDRAKLTHWLRGLDGSNFGGLLLGDSDKHIAAE